MGKKDMPRACSTF